VWNYAIDKLYRYFVKIIGKVFSVIGQGIVNRIDFISCFCMFQNWGTVPNMQLT